MTPPTLPDPGSPGADPAPRFDLQSHSVHSDGTLSAADVVAAAAAAGVRTLALTDHDATSGVAEARTAAAAAGIALVPAVEMTAADGVRADLHVLGYRIDVEDDGLQAALARSRGDRERRAQRMADALRGLGFALDEELLAARAARGQAIGRPHLAQAVVAREENRARLAEQGLRDATDVLVAYLVPGAPAFRAREAPTVREAIALIHGAGGLAVWAHPFWDVSGPDDVLATIERFRGMGLDGVEAFYVTHTEAQARLLAQRCARDGLIATGSSDFHGPDHRTFSRFRAFATYGLVSPDGPFIE